MNDIVFLCKKCQGHKQYVDRNSKWFDKPTDCPECGEEGNENWILIGTGCYEKDYPENINKQ